MSITVNGQSKVPPGFRFHPTEEELLNYYLRKKLACEKIDLDVIRDVDLNRFEPWDIQEKCRIGSTPQNDWYFFSHKDKKYPTGRRTNRATTVGFWKATGRDKVIYTSLKRIGMRKTLVFYKGRAPHGQKLDWIMHEYRLDDHHNTPSQAGCCSIGEVMGQEDGWVVCRMFKKKNYHKALDGPTNNSSSTAISDGKAQMLHSGNDRALGHNFHYIGRSCNKQEEINNPTTTNNINNNNSSDDYLKCVFPTEIAASTGDGQLERFMKLPGFESPSLVTTDCAPALVQACSSGYPSNQFQPVFQQTDWTVLDRLVASHLINGQTDTTFGSFGPQKSVQTPQDYGHSGDSDMDLWAFTRSGSSNSGLEHHFHMSG